MEQPMVLVKSPESHDLVLEFDAVADRKKFLTKLEGFLAGFQKNLEVVPITRESLLMNAETKERRDKRLEHFFREAYAVTFGLKPSDKKTNIEEIHDISDAVMTTSLTQEEFASALGMTKDELFVKKMFKIVNKEKDGRISFQEFLDTVVLFTRGGSDDKLRIIFEMLHEDDDGRVAKADFKDMLTSLVDIAKTERIHNEDVSNLINSMFKSAGLQDKEALSYDDFRRLMKEFKGDFLSVGLDCKGAHQNFVDTTSNIARMTNFALDGHQHDCKGISGVPWVVDKWHTAIAFLEDNRQNIFYLVIFYVITFALFIERFMRKCSDLVAVSQ